MTVDISSIKVGVRHRKDLGDITSLKASIADIGLLHPIVVRPDMELIAGERRLEVPVSDVEQSGLRLGLG